MFFKITKNQGQSESWSEEVFFSILILFLFFGYITGVYFPIIWNESDDIAIKHLASGYYSNINYSCLIFSNILWGMLLKSLYLIKPSTQWYSWTFVFLYQLANSVFVFLIFRRSFSLLNFLLFSIFLNLGLLLLNIEYQFTIIASLCAIAGYSLFIFASIENQKSVLWTYISFILILLSLLIRVQSFYLISFVFIPVIIYLKYNLLTKKYILFPIILLITIISANYFYYNTTEWKYYMNFNKHRGGLVDNYKIKYSDFESEMTKIGWSKNDFDFIKSHQYECNEKFSIENLEYFSKLYYSSFLTNISSSSLSAYTYRIFILLLLLFILSIAFRDRFFNLFYISFILILLILLLLSKDKKIPDRVMLPFLFAGYSTMIYFFQYKFSIHVTKVLVSFFVCCSLMMLARPLTLHFQKVHLFEKIYSNRLRDFAFNYHPEIDKKPIIIIPLSALASKVFLEFRIFENPSSLANNFKLIPKGWLSNTVIQRDFAANYKLQESCLLTANSLDCDVLLVDMVPNEISYTYIKENYPLHHVDTMYIDSTKTFCAFKIRKNTLKSM